MAVKADLGGGSTKVVIGVVTLFASAIEVGLKVMEELIVFVQLRVSVVVTVIRRVGKNSKGAK